MGFDQLEKRGQVLYAPEAQVTHGYRILSKYLKYSGYCNDSHFCG
jgi:hypothetical protein